jgi:hypothetical protein
VEINGDDSGAMCPEMMMATSERRYLLPPVHFREHEARATGPPPFSQNSKAVFWSHHVSRNWMVYLFGLTSADLLSFIRSWTNVTPTQIMGESKNGKKASTH